MLMSCLFSIISNETPKQVLSVFSLQHQHLPPIGTPVPGAVVLPLGGGLDGAFRDGNFETLYLYLGMSQTSVESIGFHVK